MVGVIILNYKNYQVSIQCVESILSAKNDVVIVLVDNGSHNESATVLEKKYRDHHNIHVLCINENVGFARANNVGLNWLMKKYSNIQYCILANSDIVFRKGTIRELENAVEYYEDAVIVGPKILKLGGVSKFHQRCILFEKLIRWKLVDFSHRKGWMKTMSSMLQEYSLCLAVALS